MPKTRSSANLPASFLQKTYSILEDSSVNDIVEWSDDGCSFVIKKPTEFTETVLPKYFKHNNLASFVRQLNMYDFHKCRGNTNDHVFKHPMFLRDRPDLLTEIHRKTSENNWQILPKAQIARSELAPMLQRLYQQHKRSQQSENEIKKLEGKVSELTDQNKMLVSQLWNAENRIKKIERALMLLASYMQSNNRMFDLESDDRFNQNLLQIAGPDKLPMKHQRDEDWENNDFDYFDSIIGGPTIEQIQLDDNQNVLSDDESIDLLFR